MACQLANREQIIEDYLLGRLDEEALEKMDQHVYVCDECFNELEFRQKVAHSVQVGAKSRYGQTSSILRNWQKTLALLSAAFVVVAMLGLLCYYAALPKNYELARLSPQSLKIIRSAAKADGTGESGSAWHQAAHALLLARQTKWGIVPSFGLSEVETSISALQKALQAAPDTFVVNQLRYFMAKAYLMKSDVENARRVLQKIVEDDNLAYREQAIALIEQIEHRRYE